MAPVGLYDRLWFNCDAPRSRVQCAHPRVPEDEANLAFQALERFAKALGRRLSVEITIEKHIPVAAGLGGGSSDAAAVLRFLNQYWQAPFTQDDLVAMGADIGADVPFFVGGKPALASGIGEHLTPWEGLPPYQVLLVFPRFEVSTAGVFKNLNLRLTKCEKKLKYSPFKNQVFDISRHLCNDLEAVTASDFPDITVIKAMLLRCGADGALMSGSGPTVFGLFTDPHRALCAYHALSQHAAWQLFLVDLRVA
jgi:4-diphosphocytidyl-2-C-methyl-D-erythritol kinase